MPSLTRPGPAQFSQSAAIIIRCSNSIKLLPSESDRTLDVLATFLTLLGNHFLGLKVGAFYLEIQIFQGFSASPRLQPTDTESRGHCRQDPASLGSKGPRPQASSPALWRLFSSLRLLPWPSAHFQGSSTPGSLYQRQSPITENTANSNLHKSGQTQPVQSCHPAD